MGPASSRRAPRVPAPLLVMLVDRLTATARPRTAVVLPHILPEMRVRLVRGQRGGVRCETCRFRGGGTVLVGATGERLGKGSSLTGCLFRVRYVSRSCGGLGDIIEGLPRMRFCLRFPLVADCAGKAPAPAGDRDCAPRNDHGAWAWGIERMEVILENATGFEVSDLW